MGLFRDQYAQARARAFGDSSRRSAGSSTSPASAPASPRWSPTSTPRSTTSSGNKVASSSAILPDFPDCLIKAGLARPPLAGVDHQALSMQLGNTGPGHVGVRHAQLGGDLVGRETGSRRSRAIAMPVASWRRAPPALSSSTD